MMDPPEFAFIGVTVLSLPLEEEFLWAHAGGAWSLQAPAHEASCVALPVVSVLVTLLPGRSEDGYATFADPIERSAHRHVGGGQVWRVNDQETMIAPPPTIRSSNV